MRVVGWSLLLLLALPAASACTMSSPSPGTFSFLQWVGPDHPDRLTFGFHDSYYTANVTTRTVEPAGGPTPYPAVAPAAAFASAPGGYGRLNIRTVEAGMIAGCSGPYPYTVPVGADLRDDVGNVVRSWGSGDANHRWSGAIWGNATHGFVWEHGPDQPPAATTGHLHVITWATFASTTTALDIPTGHAWNPFAETAPETVAPDQLLLMGEDGAVLIDPRGPSTRAIASPVPGGWAQRDGDAILFGRWDNETGHGHGDLTITRVRIADGVMVWKAQGHGGLNAIVPRGLALIDAEGGRLLRWRDGIALVPIELGADTTMFPPAEGPPVATLVAQGSHVAIGVRGPQERLLVLGPDLEVVLEAAPYPLATTSTTHATPVDEPNDDEIDSVLDAPSPPVVALLAVAVAALVARRRL